MPLDQLKSEQSRISDQLTGANALLSGKQLRREQLDACLDSALDLLAHAGDQYASAANPIRRQLNQSVYERIWLSDDEVEGTDLQLLFRRLLDCDLATTLQNEADDTLNGEIQQERARISPAPPSPTD